MYNPGYQNQIYRAASWGKGYGGAHIGSFAPGYTPSKPVGVYALQTPADMH